MVLVLVLVMVVLRGEESPFGCQDGDVDFIHAGYFAEELGYFVVLWLC